MGLEAITCNHRVRHGRPGPARIVRVALVATLGLATGRMAQAAPPAIEIPEVDQLEVIAVVDNFYDCFQRDEKCAIRHNTSRVDSFDGIRLQAEMGLAFVIRARVKDRTHLLLFDFGLTPSVYQNNLRRLGIDIARAEALVLSHAHQDHYSGLEWAAGKARAPIYVGDGDAFLRRRSVTPAKSWDMGTLPRDKLQARGARFEEAPIPRVVAGVALLSGRIPQVTPYEKVPPFLQMWKGGRLVPDPMTHELALGFRVHGKGLVVITSCAHAGVINSVEHLRRITGENRVAGLIGGMHLTAATDEVVEKTVEALASIKPTFVAPMHCTGERALARLRTVLPAAYVHPSVGTIYRFEGTP